MTAVSAARDLAPGASEALAIEAAALQALPGFPFAARSAAHSMAELHRGNFIVNRLLNDRGRFVLALLVLDLHFNDEEGLTASRLKACAAAMGVCSPGRASAVLAAFRLLGMVEAAPATDRRQRRLAASERYLALHRLRWHSMLDAMARLRPESAEGAARLNEPAFAAAYVAGLLAPFKTGWRFLTTMPELGVFADRDAGMVIALSLMESGEGRPAPPIAHLARQFGVSRAHVLDVLRAGERAGLLRRLDARGSPCAEPALVAALESFIAAVFALHARALRHACDSTSL
ncbi:MAG TPA: hypothetical protein VLA00_16140 [Xanthobacteraceae bacterium]|nr:hypothetical protein [Xanthobacteraceae bacterium]